MNLLVPDGKSVALLMDFASGRSTYDKCFQNMGII